MFDGNIIAACVADGDAYRKIAQYVDPKEFTPTGAFWWQQVDAWYKRDQSAKAIDLEMMYERGRREGGRNAESLVEYLMNLPPAPSAGNVAWELLELKRTIKYRELAVAVEAEWDREKILQLTQEHYDLMQATDLKDDPFEWSELTSLEERDRDNVIPLHPPKLNAKLDGGADRGSFLIVFGRKESGKTLFACHQAAHWLRGGYKVLYLGNEEPIKKAQERILWNLSGMNKFEVRQHEEEAWSRAHRKGWKNLYAAQLFPGTPSEIEEAIKVVKPDCMIIDQLRNVRGGAKAGTRAQNLDAIAGSIRWMLNKYRAVGLMVGQAHAGEHGKEQLWFNTDDFDESRTGVPGAADAMFGLGFNHQLDAHNQRALSLPANKLSGDHEGFVITIDKKRSSIL